MAIKTLQHHRAIGGFFVCRATADERIPIPWVLLDRDKPVFIDDSHNLISFKIQDGPIKEVGVNGCQIDTLIHAAREILAGFQRTFPCEENEGAMMALEDALGWLDRRKKNRESRCVEGTSKP